MCTVVLRLTPGGLLLLGIRDEFLGRPWRPPGAHWPGLPLIGGMDERAGGTWLAVHPGERRVACVLNGRGQPARDATRRSRGDLPLRAATGREIAELDRYDPFHLVYADTSGGWVLSWDGTQAARTNLELGTHLLTNAGLVYPGESPDEKGAYFGPRFQSATPAEWAALASGDGLAPDDPRAIIVRRDLPDGQVWGTSSISMVAIDGAELCYCFGVPDGELAPVPIDGPPVTSSSSTGASRRSSSK
ncbi:MAG: NRDE family protein [Streptosporangiaceae bacterium]